MNILSDKRNALAEACQYVCQLWAKVLNVEVISLDSHFLDLGGDSLSAMLCISRIRATYKVELSLEDFLAADTGTVEGIAAELVASGNRIGNI